MKQTVHMQTSTTPLAHTVSEINGYIQDLLESQCDPLWIKGEIAQCTRSAAGHLYFTLKDPDAQLRCVMFRTHANLCDAKPEEGIELLCYGQLKLYQARGDFQLQVLTLKELGVGDMQQVFEKIKKQLAQKGLFDAQYKKSLPEHPQTIGIITSAQGAALHDCLNVLKRRAPHISIILYPSQVQGEEAPAQLIHAIRTANERSECDALLLVRGGGSPKDLAAFNDVNLAHVIFASKLPILTGIGHEINLSIADLVADQYASTPSSAAEILSAHIPRWHEQIEQIKNRFQAAIQWQIRSAEQQLMNRSQAIYRFPKQWSELETSIQTLKQRLIRAQHYLLQQQDQQLKTLRQGLQHISPLHTLKRGYAIAQHAQGAIIRSKNQVSLGDQLLLRLADGTLICQVMVKDS